MRLLQLHSDFVEYEPIEKEIKEAEEGISKDKVRLEDLVVTLVAIENGDDETVAQKAFWEIKRYLKTIGSKKLLIYPYAHLSSNLSSPQTAFQLLKSLERIAKESAKEEEKDGEIEKVYRAPFGWTKAFHIKIKGHPLAENAKVLTRQEEEEDIHSSMQSIASDNSHFSQYEQEEKGEDNISSALRAEQKLESSWHILRPRGGELIPIAEYSFKEEQDSNLYALVNYERQKRRTVDEQPPHVRLMKKLAIADYEPASDVGNIRYYPKGKLIKSLIENFVTKKVLEYGAIEVETPIMYDSKHPSMESYFNRFPARQYNIISDNKQLFLRFAACFGQFLMAKDFQLSYKHLPLKLYELTRYSFRREKSGELVGLRRLRAFSMPDCHAFCMDIHQAKQELLKRLELSLKVVNGIGLSSKDDLEMVIRFTEEFYNENKVFINELVSKFNKPVLVEMWKERPFYFILKWEFNFIDNLGKASALSTDQVDVENASRYQIEFVDENGNKRNPIILHNSPSGAVERVIYALLEKAAKVSKMGGIASIPLWLSHTQVRIIPVVNEKHINFCEKIANDLSSKNIRIDIDDRQESVAKKIRESESEWIRYALVIGDREIETQKFVVRDRNEGKQRQMILEEIVSEITTQLGDKPYIPLNLPKMLSYRPQIMV